MNSRHLALLVSAALLSGCAQYANVSERKAQFRPIRTTVGALVSVEQSLVGALKTKGSEPLKTLGVYLAAADVAALELGKNPGDKTALSDYNYAVARVIMTIRDGNLDPWSSPLQVPGPDGSTYVLDLKRDPRKAWNPALYRLTPADQFDVKGTYVSKRELKEGLGAPLVATGKETNANAREEFQIPRTYYGVTAVINFKGKHGTISILDPLAQETTTFQGHTFPLAADFTVPIAVMLASTNPKSLELSRALRPEKYADTARLARLQPYDPNKTVVLVIHGLMDTPATWTPILNTLRADPIIRQNYQFWFFSYPSGYPYPYSAAILRRELDGIQKIYPIRKPMVVIGHSMGACIARELITDADDKLWKMYFGKPPGELHFTPETTKFLTEALIFQHRPEIGRVIFISGPHRGSELATNWLGRIGSGLVKAPSTLVKVGSEATKALVTDGDSLKLKGIPNSVDTLAPTNRFVIAINTLPITPGIPYHSIMGDRGKGGNKDHTKPISTDGIVPYWSSHLDGAESELIVPSGHGAHQNAQAIAEVRRILEKYASTN